MIKRGAAAALVVVALMIAWVPSTAGAESSSGETPTGSIERAAEPIAGQYIVKLRELPASRGLDATADALADRYSGRVLEKFESVNGFVARLSENEALALSTDPSVELVEEDGMVHATATQTPTPSWGLDRIDQAVRPLDNTYTYDADGTGVIAYAIDSGILVGHADFGGRATVGIDLVGDGQNGNDCAGHGTHVAGILGGTTYGVAKQVSLVAVRVLDCAGNGSLSDVIDGIEWVTDNHNQLPPGTPAVANMSLGGTASTMLDNAVEASIASGITYVVAAGNLDKDACSVSPARSPNALTVGATTSSDARSSFSNWGTCLDLFAPGSEITSAWISGPTSSKVVSGTSMAAPHVSGVVARYLQLHPTATPAAVNAAVSGAACHAVTDPGPGSNDLLVFAGLGTGSPPGLPASCGAEYVAVAPARVLDTRGGNPGVTCNPALGAVGEGATRDVKVTGCVGVPTTQVAAVVMNVTVDVPTTSSFLTVWPKGAPLPTVSNLNFLAGQTVPNLVTAKVGTNGMVSLYNRSGAVHVIVDVVGWYVAPGGPVGSRFHALAPARLLDTRDTAPIGPNALISLPVTNTGGVPASPGVTAIVVNVTATQPTATSFLTVFPGDLAIPPGASNLNFVAAQTVANLVIVQVPTSGPSAGTIKIYNKHGFTHVIVDVVGWYDDDDSTIAGLFHSLAPARVLDTRFSSPIGPNTNRVFTMSGMGGVPTGGVGAVVMNTTVAQPTADGFITVYPAASGLPPGSSNVNFVAGQVVPNLVISGVSAGSLRYYNLTGFTHVIFDVAGYFTSS